MFQIASTASVNLTTGVITPSDPISARASLTLTLAGTGSLSAANMRTVLYRLNKNGIDVTLVATCSTFTGPANAFVGTMSLNTTELVAAFTAISARQYETLRFNLLVYDASESVYIVDEHLDVAYEVALAGATPGHVSPITTSTITWGNFRLSGGVIYIQNLTDGLFYPLRLAGASTQVHADIPGDGGIVL